MKEFATEANYDKLKIFDGQDNMGNVIKILEGELGQHSITSTRNEIFLEFTSDPFGGKNGFLIRYSIKKGEQIVHNKCHVLIFNDVHLNYSENCNYVT